MVLATFADLPARRLGAGVMHAAIVLFAAVALGCKDEPVVPESATPVPAPDVAEAAKDLSAPDDIPDAAGPPPIPTFVVERPDRRNIGGITLGDGKAWLVSVDGDLDDKPQPLDGRSNWMRLEGFDITTGALVEEARFEGEPGEAEIAASEKTIYVRSFDESNDNDDLAVGGSYTTCYRLDSRTVATGKRRVLPGFGDLGMAIGEDGNMVALDTWGTLAKYDPDCQVIAKKVVDEQYITDFDTVKQIYNEYYALPMIMGDRIWVAMNKDLLFEVDYETLDVVRRIELPAGHVGLPVIPLPDGRLIIHGGDHGISTFAPGDLAPTVQVAQYLTPYRSQSVVRSDGALVGTDYDPVLWRWWSPRRRMPGRVLGNTLLRCPMVSDDDEAWAVGTNANTDSAGNRIDVSVLLGGFREKVNEYGDLEAAGTRDVEILRWARGDDDGVPYTAHPVVPREGQVLYVTSKRFFSAAVPGIRPPNPTYWATAHGNQARDRRWRKPVPAPRSVGGVIQY